MVEIIKKKFDQDLFLNLWCNPLGYFAKMNSTLGYVVPLAMFFFYKIKVRATDGQLDRKGGKAGGAFVGKYIFFCTSADCQCHKEVEQQ